VFIKAHCRLIRIWVNPIRSRMHGPFNIRAKSDATRGIQTHWQFRRRPISVGTFFFVYLTSCQQWSELIWGEMLKKCLNWSTHWVSEKTVGEIGPLLDQRKEENVRLNDRSHLISMNEGGDNACLVSGDQRAEEGREGWIWRAGPILPAWRRKNK
jgi:hypothetical protein